MTSKGGQKDVKKWSKGGQIDYRGLGGRIRLLERFDKGTRFLCESGKNYKSLRKIIKLLVRPLSERQTTGMKLQIKLKIVSSRGGEGAN